MIATNGIADVNGHTNGSSCLPPMTVVLELPSQGEIKDLNVHQRIRWITAEVRSLPKLQWNPEGEFLYAGHDQIVDMLRILLAKYGVNIYQEPLEFTRETFAGTLDHLTRVKYEYEVVNADDPNDKFVRHNWGEALDWGDKGLNKCSTVAEKVFLLRLFKIATYDDPDAHSAQRRQNRPAPQNGDKGRGNKFSGPGPNECQQCGELITTVRRDNKTWQSDEVIALSKKHFGKRLCGDCFLKAPARDAGKSSQSNGSSTVKPVKAAGASPEAQSADATPKSGDASDKQATTTAAATDTANDKAL